MVLTAKEWGWSPTAILRNAKNPRKSHPADYNFATAVRILTEEKCPVCGVPIWHGMARDPSIAYKLRTVTCHACEHKDENEPKGDKKKAGESYVVYPVPELGFDELPSRADYFKQAHKDHLAEHEKDKRRRARFEAGEQVA